ncbi:NupC/NupG family nucleoside CNT transporter [Chromobacterium sphagni]|uniref:Na+ dependent nucleoside transporter domain-containing protein n=1 Tax=Chromobacterium sphagni TaxID=1903179 RepID=A0A1S1WTX4_9NEIS|nr:nucleoside transporter C-terminal domain-containing protein [Chromobacterium sphagni]OHX10742.1 Na+ dependent nucleoside transporter domain-containing protein [Chromobacterium sphagni]OHX16561.1 Na+ dependent nucleoside transporter domain-containing protein [Chromobacterium sphagni]
MNTIQALAGMLLLVGVAYAFSTQRSAVNWRTVLIGLAIQSGLFLLINYLPAVRHGFDAFGSGFAKVLGFAGEGARFIFGDLANPGGKLGFLFAFMVLPVMIFFSALTALLYHFGILQRVVAVLAWLMKRSMRLSGPESVVTAANIFLGQTEAPLLVRPYIRHMTRSELACIMIAGMSTLSGGVLAAYVAFLGGADLAEQARFATYLLTASCMNAAGAAVFCKIMFPEVSPEQMSCSQLKQGQEKQDGNFVGAIVTGALDGMKMAAAVATILLAIVSLIALANYAVKDGLGELLGVNSSIRVSTHGMFDGLTLQYLVGQVFRVFAFLMGIGWDETLGVGSLLGQKIVLNEFIAYLDLAKMKAAGTLSPQTVMIATFALASFSNFSSVGICVAGIGALAPERQKELAQIGMRALLASIMTGFMTASTTGLWLSLF